MPGISAEELTDLDRGLRPAAGGLVSEEAKRSAGVAGVEFELIGDVTLRGVSRAVRLHKATRA